jgi:hypothetical protein
MPNCLRINSPRESLILFLSASTWAEDFTLVNWRTEQKNTFLKMQFGMQRQQDQCTHPVSHSQIIHHNYFRVGQRIVPGTKVIF